jgi:hypothetical protein
VEHGLMGFLVEGRKGEQALKILSKEFAKEEIQK